MSVGCRNFYLKITYVGMCVRKSDKLTIHMVLAFWSFVKLCPFQQNPKI